MSKAFFAVATLLVFPHFAHAQGTIYHQGYTNHNGTYVQPHYQTAPNNTPMDNWSTRGNTNPYTGQAGTVNPYQPQSQTHTQPRRTWP